MAKSVVIIPPTTDAVTAQVKERISTVPSTIIATGLATTEEVDVYFSVDDGRTWEALFQDGSAVVLTATDKVLSVYSPITLGFLKDATAGAAGVYQN